MTKLKIRLRYWLFRLKINRRCKKWEKRLLKSFDMDLMLEFVSEVSGIIAEYTEMYQEDVFDISKQLFKETFQSKNNIVH